MSPARGIISRKSAWAVAIKLFGLAQRLMMYAASDRSQLRDDEIVAVAVLKDEAARVVRLLERP